MDYKVFIDTNILLEVIFVRNNYKICRKLILDNYKKSYISALSIHICNYFIEKYKLNLEDYKEFFNSFEIVTLDAKLLELAYQNHNKDFEDSIQISSAISAKCDKFITLDQKLLKNYNQLINIEIPK